MMQTLLVSSAIKIAAEFFPTLATKIAGPRAEQVAQQVVDVATSAAGLGADATPQMVIAELRADEDRAQEARLRLEQLNAEEHERIIEDRADARAYQQAVGREGRLRGNIMLGGVGVGLVACVAAVYGIGRFGGGGEAQLAIIGLITTIAGALLKMFSDAFAFEFGSSRGSKEKSDQIRDFQRSLERIGERNTAVVRDVAAARGGAPGKGGQGLAETPAGSPGDRLPAERVEPDPAEPSSPAEAQEARPFTRMLLDGRLEIA